MIPDKSYLEIIKILQENNLSTFQIILILLGVIIFTLISSYLITLYKEFGKIDATNSNFSELRKQLVETTGIVKGIEKTINSELWIAQQVWQKKYDLYENIFTQLLSIKRWVDNEHKVIELHMMPHYMSMSHHPYGSEKQDKLFWKEVEQAREELEKVINDEDFKAKNKILQEKQNEAMSFLAEIMVAKSIILNPNVAITLQSLIVDFTSPGLEEDEMPDDYSERMVSNIDRAITSLKEVALEELQIIHR